MIGRQRGAVAALPYLSPGEERALVARFRDAGDLGAAHQLVCAHLRMVAAIARGYTGYGLPQDEVMQEGAIGLMKAVKRFDPARGARLAAFAAHWIHAEIREYVVRNWRLVRIATTKAQRKLFFNLRSLSTGGSLQGAEVKRIARQLRVPPREVTEMDARFAGGNAGPFSSIDAPGVAQLPAGAPGPAEELEARQSARLRAAALRGALAALDERSRRIVEQRWLREEEPARLKDLAAELRLSAEGVRQIQNKALATLREALRARGAGSDWSLA